MSCKIYARRKSANLCEGIKKPWPCKTANYLSLNADTRRRVKSEIGKFSKGFALAASRPIDFGPTFSLSKFTYFYRLFLTARCQCDPLVAANKTIFPAVRFSNFENTNELIAHQTYLVCKWRQVGGFENSNEYVISKIADERNQAPPKSCHRKSWETRNEFNSPQPPQRVCVRIEVDTRIACSWLTRRLR